MAPSAGGGEWPESLDAVVAAPAHHSILLENERVRVLDARVEAGDTVPLHTHRWPGIQYVAGFADFVRRDADGAVVVDSRELDLSKGRSCCGRSRFRHTRSRTSVTSPSTRLSWS